MPADPPELAEGSLAEEAWWARVNRAAKRKGDAGSKIMGDWSHAMLRCQCPDASGYGYELVDGRRVPITAEMFTAEYQQAECRRLCDRLGRQLGVGPMPADTVREDRTSQAGAAGTTSSPARGAERRRSPSPRSAQA